MLLNKDRMLRRLENAINSAGGQHQFARLHGLSQTIVSTTRTGFRHPSPKVLRALGLERVVAYQQSSPAQSAAKSKSQ